MSCIVPCLMAVFGSALPALEFGLGYRKSESIHGICSTAIAAMLVRHRNVLGTMYTTLYNHCGAISGIISTYLGSRRRKFGNHSDYKRPSLVHEPNLPSKTRILASETLMPG